MGLKFKPIDWKVKVYDYDKLDNETSDEDYDDYGEEECVSLSDMLPIASDAKEVEEGKWLKILTPKKLLTRHPILSKQIKAGNNSYKLKNEIRQIQYLLYQHNKIENCLNISMKTIFLNVENSKTIESHKFVLNLSQRLDLISSKKHVALQNLSIYYSWKNIRKQYKNNKLKILAPTWNDEIELVDGSYSISDNQDYIE